MLFIIHGSKNNKGKTLGNNHDREEDRVLHRPSGRTKSSSTRLEAFRTLHTLQLRSYILRLRAFSYATVTLRSRTKIPMFIARFDNKMKWSSHVLSFAIPHKLPFSARDTIQFGVVIFLFFASAIVFGMSSQIPASSQSANTPLLQQCKC